MTDAQHARRIRAARDKLLSEIKGAQKSGLHIWWDVDEEQLGTDTKPKLEIAIERHL